MDTCKHCGEEIRLIPGRHADEGEPPSWKHVWPGEPEHRWQSRCALYAEPAGSQEKQQ